MKTSYRSVIFCFRVLILALSFAVLSPIPFLWAQTPHPQSGKPEYVIRIGSVAPAGVSYMKYVEKDARKLEELTDHRLKLELVTGGILGDEFAMAEMVRKGELDGALVTSFTLEDVAPESMVIVLPLLFNDEFELDYIVKKYEPFFAQRAREQGIELLALVPAGCAAMFTTVPVPGFDDLADRKVVRLENSKFFQEAMGSNFSVPLSPAGIEPALRSGRVEVVFGPPTAAIILGWYPYIRYVYMGCFAPAIVAFIFNADRYQHLPPEIRSLIQEFVREQRIKSMKLMRRDNEIAMLGLMKRGAKIIQISPEEKEKQTEVMKETWERGVGKWYPRELLEGIIRDLEAYRGAEDWKKKPN